MIVLQASHIAKQFLGHDVLLDATLTLQHGEKVALVGPNGAGKSTLIRIITGNERADAGEISLAKGTSMGYVAQHTTVDEDTSVFAFVAATFQALYDMEQKIHDLAARMADPSVYSDQTLFSSVSQEYDRLQKSFEDQGGYAIEARIRRVLTGLNFPTHMHQAHVMTLSGGQKTRLALARLLAWEPDILVLDEPTNYLDTETLTWLEDYLSTYAGAVLVVSHDRYFLDRVATTVYELEGGRTTRFTGNYSAYMETKAALFEQESKRYEAQQKEIARLESFVQKNIVRASTTKRAQSRRKLLERIERIDRPTSGADAMSPSFTCARSTGKDVLRTEGLVIGYPGKRMAGPVNLYVPRGQRLAIIGPNGIGKTTLLKTLVGHLAPYSGRVVWGTHVDIGYYDQEQTQLDPGNTVLEQVWGHFPKLDMTTVRTALGRFLFRGEDVEKQVSALSGGERSRLALCQLMLKQANVLIFDEPTNHLDLLSKEVLEDALQDYEGTILFVSHDRYFIDAIATHVLRVDETGVQLYLGNYTEYVEKVRSVEKWADETPPAARATKIAVSRGEQGTATSTHPEAPPGPEESGRRHVRSADLRKLRDRVAGLEERISENEAAQESTGHEIMEATTSQDFATVATLQQTLSDLEAAHAKLLEEWELAAAELEELESYL